MARRRRREDRTTRWLPGTWRGGEKTQRLQRPSLSVMVLGHSPLALALARAVAASPAVVMVHGVEERPVAATVMAARPDLLILCDPADPELAEHVLEQCGTVAEPPTTRLVVGLTRGGQAVLRPVLPLAPLEHAALADVLEAVAPQLSA